MKVINIDLDLIEQNENTRTKYKKADLTELMASMKADGLLQPIGVRTLPKGKYDAVFGNRRIEAAKLLGWTSIEANVVKCSTENDRDVLNLIENLKRQNTTVAEDGRMFSMLQDRGLSIGEIGARVGISAERIELALEVFNDVPKDIQKQIVNRTSGVKRPGTISASAASSILNIKRLNSLTKGQTAKLFDFAKKDDTNLAQLRHCAPLLKEGYSINEAIKVASGLVRVTLAVYVDQKVLESVEKKREMSYTKALMEVLLRDKALGVQNGDSSGYDKGKRNKLRTIIRRSVER